MRRLAPRTIALATAVALTLLATSLAAVTAGQSDLDRARAATARFHSLEQAERAGYALPPAGPLHECIASFDGTGAMGYHLINGALLDGVIDPTKPEVLVYAPDARGRLRLVALEYVVFDAAWTGEMAPMLFGEMFMPTGSPNRYEIPAFHALHAWIWETNPSGTFAGFNPNVSC